MLNEDAMADATSVEPRARFLPAAALFAVGAGLLLVATRLLIPILVESYEFDPLLAWFTAVGFGVLLPLILLGCAVLRLESRGSSAALWTDRLRFRRLGRFDWLICGASLAAVALLTALVALVLVSWRGPSALYPAFLPGLPLSPGRYWLLWVWPVFWTVNILGEEFVWRGVLLPQQESAHGRWAWFFNGAGWSIFHAVMGWQLVMLLPLSFILPYAVQRSGKTSVGVILHAAINGPAFLAISLGAL